ncbi:MAG: DUF427 domain-containing protein [Nocardioides sp.]
MERWPNQPATHPQKWRATWNGAVLAESRDTVLVEGNHYFPREALVAEHFTSSDHHTVCGWKGTASYLTVIVDGASNPDAAWYYPEPMSAAEEIRDRVAFWRGVVVSSTP